MKKKTPQLYQRIADIFKTDDEFVQFYNASLLELGSNECGMHDFALRVAHGKRLQQHYTFHFVLRGKGELMLAGKTFPVKENDFFVVPPSVIMNTTPDKDEPWKYFWIGFNGKGAETLISSAQFSIENPVYSCQECAEEIRETLEKFYKFIPATSEAMRMRALGVLFELFGLITQERCKYMKEKPLPYSKEYYRRRTLELIDENYADSDFKVDTLCEMLSISHSYLCRIFRESATMTVNQYLIQIRMRNAQILLDKNEDDIKNVAAKVGYNDYSYFSKEFKKQFGMTPGQYRSYKQKLKKAETESSP